jgi:short-subunit dehydrogenase
MERSAIVTGAAAGIGASVALLLAQRGFHLTLLDLDLAALEATAADM